LHGRERSPAEARAWGLLAWAALYFLVLLILTAWRPLPVWILLNPLFAIKCCYLAGAALVVKSLEDVADRRPGLPLAAAAVGLVMPLLVYQDYVLALAFGVFCLALVWANIRPRAKLQPESARPRHRWLFASFALPVIWLAASCHCRY
jgi:hypothetical protein